MSEWISVKERLPEESLGQVLCVFDGEAWRALDEEHYEEQYAGPVAVANTVFARAHAGQYITHWMPLPQPPDAQGNVTEQQKSRQRLEEEVFILQGENDDLQREVEHWKSEARSYHQTAKSLEEQAKAIPRLYVALGYLLEIEDARISTGAFKPNTEALKRINFARQLMGHKPVTEQSQQKSRQDGEA